MSIFILPEDICIFLVIGKIIYIYKNDKTVGWFSVHSTKKYIYIFYLHILYIYFVYIYILYIYNIGRAPKLWSPKS